MTHYFKYDNNQSSHSYEYNIRKKIVYKEKIQRQNLKKQFIYENNFLKELYVFNIKADLISLYENRRRKEIEKKYLYKINNLIHQILFNIQIELLLNN